MPFYEVGSQLNNSATGVAAAAVSCALTPSSSTRTVWIEGFHVTSSAPASTVSGTITITGVNTIGNVPLTYQLAESATFGGEVLVMFPGDGEQAAQAGQPITVSVSAITSGGVVSIVVLGYQI